MGEMLKGSSITNPYNYKGERLFSMHYLFLNMLVNGDNAET